MTLTNRLSLFFLTTLALVLAGFSGALYALASAHLHRQADERLDAALQTLTAAVEVGPGGVEWEPAERQLLLGVTALEGRLGWLVGDPDGRVVDQSIPAGAAEVIADVAGESADGLGGSWRFRQRWVKPTDPGVAPAHPPEEGARKYPQLSLTVGMTLEPVRATLRRLAWSLLGLSLAVWLVALLAGRAVCRRALLPVTQMATSARQMDAADPDGRLPAAATGDELEDLSRAFNGLLDRLQEAFERQRRFTGEASHQLRTPLAAMLGQVEVALRRERPAEEYRRVLAAVQQQAERLRRIVEALLFLARADAEARAPDREPVDLPEWLAAHLRTWAEHPRANDLIFDTGGVGRASAEVHPVLLGELINILLDNACKYSPPGSPIALQLRRAGGAVEIAVHDRGRGISPEDMPYLFRPFFRSREARRRGVEGLGLGLAIAKRLAAALGGSITATSGAGGSCFTLRLPKAGPAADVTTTTPAARE